MNNRRALTVATTLLGAAAIVFASWPFLASLSLSATAGQSLPHLDIRGLSPGNYAYYEAGSLGRWRQDRYLVIHQTDDTFTVLEVGSIDEMIVMPDLHWWGISGICIHFSLPPPRGRLPEDGELRCLDADISASYKNAWRWDRKGENITRSYSDIVHREFVLEGDEIVVGKRH